MAEILKDMFNINSITEVGKALNEVYPTFDEKRFLVEVMDSNWINLELKQRARRINEVIGAMLPKPFAEALEIYEKASANFSLAFIFPDFIDLYGQNGADWDRSVQSLGRNTQYWTAEFAVRPFIIKDETRMMDQMYAWSQHENEHYRRLASEGCRPQLPWAPALNKFKKDPTPVLRILEQLKEDPSLYVRRSVANNLNDISKTHPQWVIEIATRWYGDNEDTNWIVKHACRTLLKKGNPEVLNLFGYRNDAKIKIKDFTLSETSLTIGDSFLFSFKLNSLEKTKLRLEYAVDYVKANGKRNRKIFQISERLFENNEEISFTKKHAFANLTT